MSRMLAIYLGNWQRQSRNAADFSSSVFFLKFGSRVDNAPNESAELFLVPFYALSYRQPDVSDSMTGIPLLEN